MKHGQIYQPPPRSGCGYGSGGRTGDEQESRCLDKAAALRKRRGRDQGNQVEPPRLGPFQKRTEAPNNDEIEEK